MPELKESILTLLRAHHFLTLDELDGYIQTLNSRTELVQIREALRLLAVEEQIYIAINRPDHGKSLVGLASENFIPQNVILN